MIETKLSIPDICHPHAVVSPRNVSLLTNLADVFLSVSRIVGIELRGRRRISVDEEVPARDAAAVVVVMRRDCVPDPHGGRAASDFVVHQMERSLNPVSRQFRGPVDSCGGRQPGFGRSGDHLQRAIHNPGRIGRRSLQRHLAARAVIAGGRVAPARLPGGVAERLVQHQVRWLTIRIQKLSEVAPIAGECLLDFVLIALPRFLLTRQIRIDHPVFRIDPVLWIEGGKQHGLKLIVFLLRNRFEFVIVTAGTMHG